MLKSKNGFTLVEVLGVLIIISFLGFLISNILVNNISKTNSELEKVAIDLIISSARDYVSKYPNKFPKKEGREYYINYEELQKANLIDENMLPKTDKIEQIKLKKIQVKVIENKFSYSLVYLE